MDTDFLLPRPQLVHGSFFTRVAWVVRGSSNRTYSITSSADKTSFLVTDEDNIVTAKEGIWMEWWKDGVRAYYKQSTIYVRANGWEVNATRRPIYNHVSGPGTSTSIYDPYLELASKDGTVPKVRRAFRTVSLVNPETETDSPFLESLTIIPKSRW